MISALPYHKAVSEYLEKNEADLWTWFRHGSESDETKEQTKFSILKSAVRLDASGNPSLYEIAHQACERLEVTKPVTLYQVQGRFLAPNAALVYTPDEVSILLQGALLDLLDPPEIAALFGHEIAHFAFYSIEGGRYFIADRAMSWCAQEIGCPPSFLETRRRWQLSTELYADRGASAVAGAIEPVISLLIRTTTGSKSGTAKAYLDQAHEILEKTDAASEGDTHPENYIRAIALEKWSKRDEAGIEKLVGGKLAFHQLDLLGQVRLQSLTFGLIDHLVALFDDEHCRNLLQRYRCNSSVPYEKFDAGLFSEEIIQNIDEETSEYIAYVIMDFAIANTDNWEDNLQKSLDLADKMRLFAVFEQVLIKEGALTKRAISGLRKGRGALGPGATK